MPLIKTLSRSLRARDDDSASDPYSDELEVSSPSVLDTGEGGEEMDDESDDAASADGDEVDEEDVANDNVKDQLSKVSFGALAKAQDSLDLSSRKRKRGAEGSAASDAKLEALRERLREIQAGKKVAPDTKKVAPDSKKQKVPTKGSTLDSRKARTEEVYNDIRNTLLATQSERAAHKNNDDDNASFANDSSDASGPDSAAPTKSRTSKHAPTSLPSNRQVTRKRAVIDVPKRHVRDPRFDVAVHSNPADATALDKRYAFLDTYRSTELAALRTALKNPKLAPREKTRVEREIRSMESKAQAKARKQQEQDVVSKHRREEREKVGQGKQPFYLKRSEIKKQALTERFEGMKGKERERAIERRRKKVGGKEMKRMPGARRGADT